MLNQVTQQCPHTYTKKRNLQASKCSNLQNPFTQTIKRRKKICVRWFVLVAMLVEEMLPLCYSSTVYLSRYLSSLSSDSFVFFDYE